MHRMDSVSQYIINPFAHGWKPDFRVMVDELLLEYGLKRIHVSVHKPD